MKDVYGPQHEADFSELTTGGRKSARRRIVEIEVARMWNMRTTTVLLVIGTLGVIKKGVNEYLEKIPKQYDWLDAENSLVGNKHIL